MAQRVIIVHSLDHARAALAAAEALSVPLVLASAPGAAAYVGPAWFQNMIVLAAAEFPGVELAAILDCGDRAGDVLAALRQGIGQVRFTGSKAAAVKLTALAERRGAVLLTGRLQGLDLRGRKEPEAACRAWLGGAAVREDE